VIGAGIAGLTATYELLQAGFDVTVYEGQARYGGRSLTVRPADADYRAWYLSTSRFVRDDSYCDGIPAEVRGAMVGEQTARFTPVRVGDGYFDLAFNAGPGRIPTYHTGILHYCRAFGVEMEPYIFAAATNLLQDDDFNGGLPVQLRQVRYDLHGYISERLYAVGGLDPQSERKFRKLLTLFGNLSDTGTYTGSPRDGYLVAPGAGFNGGVHRDPLPFDEILEAPDLWPEVFARSEIDWQAPLLQPKGGMDLIWQAFLVQRAGEVELRDRVRLSHEVTGLRYADDDGAPVVVHYRTPTDLAGQQTHDYVVMTGAPAVLAEMETDGLLDDGVEDHLRRALYYRGGKYAWQARSRFWEAPDMQIFGGISWTSNLSSQIWYPSDGYNGPTGLLTGAYPQDVNYADLNGDVYGPGNDFREPLDPDAASASDLFGTRWAGMDHTTRTEVTLRGCEALHPGFRQHIYPESGLSISWDNQPFQYGVDGSHLPVARPDAYARLVRAVDRRGRVYLAGDYLSFLWGWQEGAVRSAWWTVGLLRDHVLAQRP